MASHPVPPVNRILMTTDTVGGVWTYALELSRALAAYDIAVALATMGPLPTAVQREEVGQLPNVELYCSPFKLEWMEDPWPDLSLAGEWLLDLENDFKPQVVHLNSYVHGSLPWSAPLVVVGHSCVLSWWRSVKNEEPPSQWDRYRRSVAQGLHSADLVVAPSQAMLDSLRKYYGSFASDKVVYNGRALSDVPVCRKEEFVLTVGRLWDEAKNVAALNDVADRLPWPSYVAGDNCHPSGGEARFMKAQTLGKLSQKDLHEWLARASIYALPARYEPFGLSVLEAALAGCALVLGGIDSLQELWEDAAVFVPPGDSGALLDAIDHLIRDPQEREEMAQRARKRAGRFTPERMAQEYLDAYAKVSSLETVHSY